MRDEIHVKEWLLAADTAELREPPPDIAQHLEQCQTCSVALRDINAGYANLDRGLDVLTQSRRRRRTWIPLSAAMAAAIAGLVLLRPAERTPAPPTLLAQLMFPPQAVVQPQAGTQAIIFERSDMNVIWLTNSQGQQ